MRVLIVDDERLAAERLARLCARLDGVEIVGFAADGPAALSKVGELKPDVLLLDISMPGVDGMALARILGNRESCPAIVFVAAHSSYAVDAFEVAATDYLLKPVSLARLAQALGRIGAPTAPVSAAPAHLKEIWAPRGRDMVRLGVETLDLLEAERDYVRLHAKGRTYLVRATIREFESRLDPDRFVRVHRSAVVPIDRIRRLRRNPGGGWRILLSTGDSVRVGRSFESRVREITTGPDFRQDRALTAVQMRLADATTLMLPGNTEPSSKTCRL